MPSGLPETTNPHFLNALIKLSGEQEIEISEDVFGQNGLKLLARGTRVSAKLYERIVNHKLVKPLELSLSMSGKASTGYGGVGETLLAEIPSLKALADWQIGRVNPLGLLERLEFPAQASAVLTLAERRSADSLRNDVLVTLVAMGIANAYRYNDPRLMVSVATAAMLHDIGELYIDPEIVQQHERAAPSEWMQYAAHPVVGATIVREVIGLDASIQRGVLEHHETMDGFGYPRALHGHALSEIGMIVGMASFISSLIRQDDPCRRIDIALKFIPGEFEPVLVNSISELIHDAQQNGHGRAGPNEEDEMSAKIHRTLLGIAGIPETFERLAARQKELSTSAWEALDRCFDRFIRLQRAFNSTGIAGLPAMSAGCSAEDIADFYFEARCVLHELGWRCRKLALELAAKSDRAKEFTDVDRACLADFSNALAAAG